MTRSASMSASETRSVGEDFVCIAARAGPVALEQHRARRARGVDWRRRGGLVAHSTGRAAPQSRPASSWPASASSVASPSGRPDDLHAHRQAVVVVAGGHVDRGLAGDVEGDEVRDRRLAVAAQPTMERRPISPAKYGPSAQPGVTSTSTSRNSSPIRRACSASAACTRRISAAGEQAAERGGMAGAGLEAVGVRQRRDVVVDPAQHAGDTPRPTATAGSRDRARRRRGPRARRSAASASTAARSSRPSLNWAPGGAATLTATRRRRAPRATAPAKSLPGAAASMNSAASAVRRASGPLTDRPCQAPSCGASGTRSRVRLEPDEAAPGGRHADRPGAVGAQRRRRTSPAATAAPVPPLEPPGRAREVPRVARGAERRRVGRRQHHQLGHVRLADDDRAGRAQRGAPPRRRAPCRPPCAAVPQAVTCPATSTSSLIATGTPSSGRSSPARRRASAWSASMRRALGQHDASRR